MTHSRHNLRRRGLVLLMVAGLLLVTAGVATAKPGSGKPQPPTQYAVTMTGALATTCPGFEPYVAMTGSGNEIDGRRQNLMTDIDVAWARTIDVGYGLSGTALTGCHGNALAPNENDLYAMWVTPDLKKHQVRILWRFDPAFDAQGDPLELFELRSMGTGLLGGPVAWANNVVDGQFSLRRWTAGASWTELGVVHLTFGLAIEKIQP